jgi:hypothetical protein
MLAELHLDPEHDRYAKCIERSRRVRWDIDTDVIRGRRFDFTQHFLPAGLTLVDALTGATSEDRRLMSQIQGRTYANVFGLVERFINAKVLEISRDHWFGDQTALEALVRFSDEELKHQELFRRVEALIAEGMPAGYEFLPDPDDVAHAVLGASTWAVLGLTCHIELFTQSHYRASIEPDHKLSPLFKDVFLYHCKEESQHAILDELEWRRADRVLDAAERDAAVDHFIGLVGAVDGILQLQAKADAKYFEMHSSGATKTPVEAHLLSAYRWTYIVSGARHPRFLEILGSLVTPAQAERIADALAPLGA